MSGDLRSCGARDMYGKSDMKDWSPEFFKVLDHTKIFPGIIIRISTYQHDFCNERH